MPTNETRRSVKRGLALTFALIAICQLAGCGPLTGENPCNPETGQIPGWVFYYDGEFVDQDRRPYALPGDRPFDGCTTIGGNISLRGELTNFTDFDDIESIQGFFENGSKLEDAPPGGAACGVIRGFPSLKRIAVELFDINGSVETETACYYLDGFESLEFVGRDFNCTGSENIGTELREVGGRLTCPEERLTKLTRVGEYALAGGILPNLRWAGRLTPHQIETVDLPMLEEVGPYSRPDEAVDPNRGPGLFLYQPSIRNIHLPTLRRIDGILEVRRTGEAHDDIYQEGRAEEIRSYFGQVEVTGRRIICRNDPTDPCPSDADCEAHYGVGSLECCGLPWPSCLQQDGGVE
jgi:hypothetical protein